ncbi:MAG: SIR2 family protein [Proteobacteria bacterium]|nr:SIR2 family protein [Pseudomonadota bacterium]
MNHILLLGAGFSHNWGGMLANDVFGHLLGCPEIANDPYLRQLLWSRRDSGGFENALAEVQRDFIRSPQDHTQHLQYLQRAIADVFADMNQGFMDIVDFEYQQFIDHTVRAFLVRFDAIFTLNQDLLLEHHYLNENIALTAPRIWGGAQLPGMSRSPNPNPAYPLPTTWAHYDWFTLPQTEFKIEPRLQPVVELHGSSNWHDKIAGPLLIMGGDKVRDIQFHPILSWYFSQFEHCLSQPDTRLMVIGYGFRDSHINTAIINAVAHSGLRFSLIDPSGPGLAKTLNPSHGGAIPGPKTALEEAFERGLMGASERSLREIFGTDFAAHRQVLRFFAA